MSWEVSLFDWNKKGADGFVVGSERVISLLSASTEEEATAAYWKLDGVVCMNGVAYDGALSVVQTILCHLPNCSKYSKFRCLELLGQISVCESDSESPDVVLKCLEEMKQFSWGFLHGLQFDSPENAWLYVDLVGVLGERFADFKNKAIIYLECVLSRNLPNNDIEMIENTLEELKT